MRRFPLVLTLGTMAWFAGGQSAWANPNMVKNGDFEQPTTLAESRLSPTENEVIFEIPGPNGFGRVIARGQDVGRDLQKTLKVGYLRPGGSSPGLMIDASDVKARGSYEISVWLDLLGQIRPNRQYAYAITCPPAGQNKPAPALEMMAPAIWADGKLMGAKVNLVWGKEKNQTADSVVKRGVVKTPDFKYQTGGQALVLKLPRDFKEQLYISRASFRELNPDILAGKNPKMPTPTRYITIDNVIEEDVASALVGATRALQQTQSPNGFWQAGGVDESVELTANIISTLARRGVDLDTRPMRKGMDWLAEQEPTKTSALAARIELFARYAPDKYRQTIAADMLRLVDGQFDDGGWNESCADDVQKDRKLHTTNLETFTAITALQEAHYAGFKADLRVWRKAAGYWRKAQARDGGFRAKLDDYGGLGEATTVANTAMGLAGLYITLDMAFADSASRCTQYLSNSAHRESIQQSLAWMEKYYDEYYKMLPTLDAQPDVGFNAAATILLTRYSGYREFRDKDVFLTEAENLVRAFDPSSGLFAGSLQLTSFALSFLNDGGAPIVVQRIVLGGSPDFRLSRDVVHMVRHLVTERKRPLNWRETDLEEDIAELLTVPLLYIHVADSFELDDAEWNKLRDYCFGGGTVVFNIAEDAEDTRKQVEAGLAKVFPEYRFHEISKKHAIWGTDDDKLDPIPGVRGLGNGLKDFVFLLPQDWSCRLNTFAMDEHPETFAFFGRLLSYGLDGEQPPESFAPSTWATGAAASERMAISHMQVGDSVPAYPDLMATLDRSLRAEYRLEIDHAKMDESSKPVALAWISCAGPNAMTDRQRDSIRRRMDQGAFIFAEVLSGNTNWAESFRSDLLKIDPALSLRKMPANHPLVTGRLDETFGYDLRVAPLRRALRADESLIPRMDAYVLERGGEEVGMFTVYDVASGLGYVMYPECRGLMPRASRQAAMNIVLYAMQRRLAMN
jgi:hypothetical protein